MALLILEVKCCGTKALGLQVRAGMGLCVLRFCEHFRGGTSLSGPGSYSRTRRMFPAPILVSGFTSCRPLVRVRVRVRHRVEQGLVLVIGRGAGLVARAAPGSVASSASEQLTVLRARRRWRGRCAPGRLRQPGRGAWPPGSGAMRLPKDLG